MGEITKECYKHNACTTLPDIKNGADASPN